MKTSFLPSLLLQNPRNQVENNGGCVKISPKEERSPKGRYIPFLLLPSPYLWLFCDLGSKQPRMEGESIKISSDMAIDISGWLTKMISVIYTLQILICNLPRIVDLVVLFPASFCLPKTEFVWPRYGKNTKRCRKLKFPYMRCTAFCATRITTDATRVEPVRPAWDSVRPACCLCFCCEQNFK